MVKVGRKGEKEENRKGERERDRMTNESNIL